MDGDLQKKRWLFLSTIFVPVLHGKRRGESPGRALAVGGS